MSETVFLASPRSLSCQKQCFLLHHGRCHVRNSVSRAATIISVETSHCGVSLRHLYGQPFPATAPRFCLWGGALPGGFAYRLHHRLCSGHAYGVNFSHIDRFHHSLYTGGIDWANWAGSGWEWWVYGHHFGYRIRIGQQATQDSLIVFHEAGDKCLEVSVPLMFTPPSIGVNQKFCWKIVNFRHTGNSIKKRPLFLRKSTLYKTELLWERKSMYGQLSCYGWLFSLSPCLHRKRVIQRG